MVMMRAISPFLEKHHNVMITDEALRDAVRLSHRYITARQLPDKEESVLETSCARVAIGLTTSPPQVEEAVRQIGNIESEMKILEKESLMGNVHTERLESLSKEKETVGIRRDELNTKWQAEMSVAKGILETRQKIYEIYLKNPVDPSIAENREKLMKLEQELREMQGDSPLVQISVDSQTISDVISGWTGIPTGRMLTDEISTVLRLEELIGQRIIGQDHALKAMAQIIQTAHAGIEDPSKPKAVFMFVGPSGVGKTETALALSELLYGGEQNLITINMSGYQEAHTVSGLKGSPPGYVGYGEGGVLTEAVRRRPDCVVLLDEVEKAHQAGEGREIDFKHTVILATSNVGTEKIQALCADPATMPDAQGLAESLRPEL